MPRIYSGRPFPGEHINRWGMPTGRPHFHHRRFCGWPLMWRTPPRPPVVCVRSYSISPLVPLGIAASVTGLALTVLGLCLPPPAAVPVALLGAGLFLGGAALFVCGSLSK